jgi:hypothetical protein
VSRRGDEPPPSRRAFLHAALATGAGALSLSGPARAQTQKIAAQAGAKAPVKPRVPRPTPPVRMRWPWPVQLPDPHALDDMVAALLGATLFPPLFLRAIDGVIEPHLASAPPAPTPLGLRVDLAPHLRPSDVVASIARARTGGGRLALKDVPVPRVDGARTVVFEGLTDGDALMRKLASPLCATTRVEPRKIAPTGPWEVSLDEATRTTLRVTRTPGPPSPTFGPQRVLALELEGPVEIEPILRAFERGDTDVSWIGDGLFQPRAAARAMDLGPLGYLALRAGNAVPELQRPGAALALVESLASDRLDHLGLLRRGHCAPAMPDEVPAMEPKVPPRASILVRASLPMAIAAAEAIALDLGCVAAPVDDAVFARAMESRTYTLALDVVRAFDDTADGVALSLATLAGAQAAPAPGATLNGVAAASTAAIGWEIALIGAQAAEVWIPRAAFGGFDLEGAGRV